MTMMSFIVHEQLIPYKIHTSGESERSCIMPKYSRSFVAEPSFVDRVEQFFNFVVILKSNLSDMRNCEDTSNDHSFDESLKILDCEHVMLFKQVSEVSVLLIRN